MKKLSLLASRVRTNSMAIVAMMILLVFAQQVQINQQLSESQIEITPVNQAEETDSEPETVLNADQNIIASSVQFHVSHVFYEIMDIVQDEEEDNFENTELTSTTDDYRKVLFSQVISPNAP